MPSADDFVFVDYDCSYGDFAVGFGGLGFGDGGSEVGQVGGHSLIGKHVFTEFGV